MQEVKISDFDPAFWMGLWRRRNGNMRNLFYQRKATYVKELPQGCVRCEYCGEIVPEQETEYLDCLNVCRDCLTDFCNGYVGQLGDEYIASHQKEFCLEWILPSYSEDDIIRAILADYERTKKLDMEASSYSAEQIKKNEQQFCLESGDWQDFVRERL